jgi:putative salt-induced outer membrane protein
MTSSSRFSRGIRASALSVLVIASFSAFAQDQPDNLWHGGISLGGAAASGNSTSKTLSANADATKASSTDKMSLFGLVNYGRSQIDGVDTTTADQARLGGRYDYNISEYLFAFGGGEAETNKVGSVDLRYGVSGGFGYKLIHTPATSMDVFGGIGYTNTRFTDDTQLSGATLVLGEESSHTLSETTTAKQRLAVYPGDSEVGTRATFDAGLATAIAGGWTLNTGLGVQYASKVAAGVKKTDTLLTVGFGYKF